MLENLQNLLKKEIKDESIFDIVVYGSYVKGKEKPNDIDIVVIFKKGSLKERLNRIQEIKKNIKTNEKIDIKSILIEELFKKELFSRSGIFYEGVSLFDNKEFSNKIGFESQTLFIYDLKNKTHTEKVKFNYLLSGRNDIGIRERIYGKQLAPGVILIPVKYSGEFEEILKNHKINFIRRDILIKK